MILWYSFDVKQKDLSIVVLQRNQINMFQTRYEASKPNNDVARLMYYFHCMWFVYCLLFVILSVVTCLITKCFFDRMLCVVILQINSLKSVKSLIHYWLFNWLLSLDTNDDWTESWQIRSYGCVTLVSVQCIDLLNK